MIIFDGHNDSLKQAHLSGRNLLERSELGQLDVPRAREGGLAGGLFAVMVPAEDPLERRPGHGLHLHDAGWEVDYPRPLRQAYAAAFVDEVLTSFEGALPAARDVEIVRDAAQLERCLETGRFAVVLHLEGAEAVAPGLENLEALHARGVRSLGLVWSRANAFGFGAPFRFPSHPDTGPGLTPAGKALVRRCNELGILVDLAHINERGFWDVAELSARPLVVSHANVNAICPSATNLLDTQIDAVGASGGVIGLMFDVLNSRPDGKPVLDTPLDVLLDHLEYLAARIGFEHVALGSDFDGGMMPTGLASAALLPNLIAGLRRRGHAEADIARVAHQNWRRVLRASWQRVE